MSQPTRRAVLGVIGLSACSRRNSVVRIAVGGQTDLVYLPTTLAHRREAFTRQGVSVEITDTGAGSKALQALLGGSADVVTGFYDHVVHMAAEGQQVKAFVTLARFPGGVLVTSPEGAKRFQSVRDLRGANVGVTAPGSSSHFFLNYLLMKNGLKPEDVSVVGMGGGRSRVAALATSQVDAGVLFEPGVSFLFRRSTGVKILADARTQAGVSDIFGTAEYPSAVLYAKAAWLSANDAVARRLAGAIRETLLWIREHTTSEIAEMMPPSFRQEDPAAYAEALEHSKSMYSHDGIMRFEAAVAVKRVLALSLEKMRAAEIDVSKTYTNEFLDPN